MPERIPSGHITSHFLIFMDPCGNMYNCPVPIGKYTPELLCTHLSNEMTKSASKNVPGVEFDVDYIDGRFTFNCELREDNTVSPVPFSLIFNHSLQFDPSKIGFSAQPLMGMSSYTSEFETHFPKTNTFSGISGATNVYRLSEQSHEKKFKIHAVTSPILSGLIIGYDNSKGILILRTYLGQLPYSHGYSYGDVVKISYSKSTDIYVYDDSGWNEMKFDSCPISSEFGRTAIVLEYDENTIMNMCILKLQVRKTPELSNHTKTLVQIQPEVQPFNFCFNLPKSIKKSMLGFSDACILWGLNGVYKV